MKYTFSLTVPKWLIYCYVMISIKISSRHEIEMFSLIAVWSEECFLHRNKWCMLTSQFSVKPENPRLVLEWKKITFEVFLFCFAFFLFSPLDGPQFSKEMEQYCYEVCTQNEIGEVSSHQSRPSNQSVTQLQAKTFSLDVKASLWPWNLTSKHSDICCVSWEYSSSWENLMVLIPSVVILGLLSQLHNYLHRLLGASEKRVLYSRFKEHYLSLRSWWLSHTLIQTILLILSTSQSIPENVM